jgi:hypothetical protein
MNQVPVTQSEMCRRFDTEPAAPLASEKVGIALGTIGMWPLNALRHRPGRGTCGWYIWGGEEMSAEPEFFSPLHVEHLPAYAPRLVPYLALPPGWRVLLAPEHEDAWYDEALVEHEG